MNELEKKVLLKLLKDNKEMKENIDYLIEANNMILDLLNKIVFKK